MRRILHLAYGSYLAICNWILWSIQSPSALCVAFVLLVGLILSVVGLFRQPCPLAGWGVALGIFGFLYLPTLYLGLFHFH